MIVKGRELKPASVTRRFIMVIWPGKLEKGGRPKWSSPRRKRSRVQLHASQISIACSRLFIGVLPLGNEFLGHVAR